MTPKQAYEARKAERLNARKMHPQQSHPSHNKDDEMLDMFDRFITAVERIADVMERQAHDQD